jgi:hypothetical protein
MMNWINQNDQLFSKSLFSDRQINRSLRSQHEKKILFRSSSSNRNDRLCYETKIDHEMKKADSQIIFDRSRELRKKSHLSNVTSQRNHLSCLVCHLNQKKVFNRCWSFNWNVNQAISHWFNQFFSEKTSSRVKLIRVKLNDNSYFDLVFSINDCFISQAAVQKQDCGITWCDYSRVMWLKWLCIERNNFDSSISTYIENCSS